MTDHQSHPHVVLRHAWPQEGEVLQALDQHAFPASVSYAQQAGPGEIEAGLAAAGILVAVRSGEILGFINFSHQAPGRSFIENFAVNEQDRGHGIGRRLLEAALAEIDAADPEAVTACTIAPANTASLVLFSKHGFVVSAYLPAYYGPGKDRLWLERKR